MKSVSLAFILLTLMTLLAITSPALAQEPASESSGKGQATSPPRTSPTPAPIEPQIVGGMPAASGAWPWQVALIEAGAASPQDGQFCGGSLIDPEWVATAAHCVVDGGTVSSPASIDVVVGIIKLSSGPTSGSTGQRLDVTEIIPNPAYNETTQDFDIALLHLASPATLNSTVGVITLAGPADSSLVAPGVTATVTGWGNTGNDFPDDLYQVSIPIVSNTTCNAPASYDGAITNNMLCAGLAAGGKDSCQGDSGGPLVVPNGAGGWLLAGIVSWGDGCAQPNLYGVYTRVTQFKAWVDGHLGFNPTVFIYLPNIQKAAGSSGGTCSSSGDSDNIADALTICSGQTVSGQVNDLSDFDDVYKISIAANQTLTISMNGSGSGDADLYLFPPGTTDVNTDPETAASTKAGNTESIQRSGLAAGTWYIDVYDFFGTVNYNLTVTLLP